MIPGSPPASSETSLEKLARAIRSLFEGGVGGPSPAASTDNAFMRWDGTDGRTAQNSTIIGDDSGNVSGIVGLAATGVVTRPNQPCFSVTKGGTDQTGIAHITFTRVTFGTELFDVGGFYDTSTSKWTPPAGKVVLTAALFWSVNVGTGNFFASIFKNAGAGSTGTTGRFKDSLLTNSGAGTWGSLITIIDDANGTDTYEVRGFGAAAGGVGTLTIDGTTATYFMGYML